MRTLTSPQTKASKSLCLSLAIAAALCATPARCYSEPYDGGGLIFDYLARVVSANRTGAKVEISGICASACTMKLGVRHVCIHSDAQLWFHAARNQDGGFSAVGTRLMMSEYPTRVRTWAVKSGALTSNQITMMSGAEAIMLGVANCDGASGSSNGS
jgi:hypothetical protein